jgi:hypothetical protein
VARVCATTSFKVNPVQAKTTYDLREFDWADKRGDKPYWMRSCSQCSVELEGLPGKKFTALLDSGAEVNLMSRRVYEMNYWPMETNVNWSIAGIGGSKEWAKGACPEIGVKIGHIEGPVNFFVQDRMDYPLILGQPFADTFRLETRVLDGGMHVGRIRSLDGTETVQFLTVNPMSERHKIRIKEPRERERIEEKDFGNASW